MSFSRVISRNVAFGSFAELNHTPKAAVQLAPIEGEADLAIHRKRSFVSGKYSPSSIVRHYIAENYLIITELDKACTVIHGR